MGDPRNTINPKTIDNERSQRDALRRLRAKIKVSDDETYLRALQNGDIERASQGIYLDIWSSKKKGRKKSDVPFRTPLRNFDILGSFF